MTRLLRLMISKILCFAMLQLAMINCMGDAYVLEERDFSSDLRNFNQIAQLLYNIRIRIGIPFSAVTNVGLSLSQILEVDPLDLALLPSGYCFLCDTIAHSNTEEPKLPSPFENEMVEIDEEKIIIICAEVDEEHGPELPFIKACPGQQEVLKNFLADLRSRGSRLAVPKERLEKAPFLEWKYAAGGGGYRCIPNDKNRTGCSLGPAEKKTAEFIEVTGPATISRIGDFADFQRSIYLGAGTGLISPLLTPLPTANPDVLPSEYYESFWSSLFGPAHETSFSIALSMPLPSTLVSIFRADARVISTSSETTISEATSTETPSPATEPSSIISIATTSSAIIFPKHGAHSSSRHGYSGPLALSVSATTKRLVTRYIISSPSPSSYLMQSPSIPPDGTKNFPKDGLSKPLFSKQSSHILCPSRQGTYGNYAAGRPTVQPTYHTITSTVALMTTPSTATNLA